MFSGLPDPPGWERSIAGLTLTLRTRASRDPGHRQADPGGHGGVLRVAGPPGAVRLVAGELGDGFLGPDPAAGAVRW